MNFKKNVSTSIVAFVISLSSLPAYSLDIQAIQAKAAEMKQAKVLLNSPDASTRLAVIEAMLDSDDISMRETAYTVGFASADDTVRAITARKRFKELKVMNFEVKLPENANEMQKKIFAKFGSLLVFNISKYNESTGEIDFKDSSKKASVSGITLNVRDKGYYTATLVMNDESIYAGILSSTYQGALIGDLPVTLRLQ
jgi:hypothetical protein